MTISFEILGWVFGALCLALLVGIIVWVKRKTRDFSVFQDQIAAQAQMEKLLEEKEAIQESIIYFARSLFRQNTIDDILWDITINCIENLQFVDCVIYLLDDERNVLIQKAAYGPKDDGNQSIVAPIEIPLGKGIVGSVAQTGEYELIGDVRQDNRYILDDEQRSSELAVPIVTPEGKVLGVIDSEHPEEGFFTNIHLKVLSTIASICAIKLIKAKADEEIMLAKEAAEAATKVKSQFLTTMSHEIRTPLNAVIGMSHLLLNENPHQSQVENLTTLHFSAKHLLSLVNNILDFSKLESEKVFFEYADFDLRELCENLQQTFAQEAAEKQLKLELKAPAVGWHLKGDTVRLNQILTNLIGNAVKFTPKGQVTTSYEVIGEEEEHLHVHFSVKDTGIGIPKEKQDKVFQQFEQASSDTTRKYGGTGLGLAICKKLVELQGGEIGLNSEAGQGTEFWFKMKFRKGRALQKEATPVHEPDDWKHKTLPGMKVLMVEDNKVNRIIGRKFLRKWEIDIEMAENGKIAVEALEKKPDYDLILMDLNMPVMGGMEATRIIRGMPELKNKRLPIVALTADVSPNVEEARASGMDGFLSKPFDPAMLFAILEKAYLERS